MHIDDESPVTDELVDYIHHGRYDRMVPFEVSIAILNHAADSRLVLLANCRHWPPFEKPAEWTAQVLRGY